jgi:hypothetical protein
MEIDNDYASRLLYRHSSFRQVYFEAVANAFDAGANVISISIVTGGSIDSHDLTVTVADNGAGFTDERFANFKKLQQPDDPYHKGVGRLVYLRYFRNVHVESFYDSRRRTFVFSPIFAGEGEDTEVKSSQESGSTLRFSGFIGDRLKTYDDIKPESLKYQLIEHFLPRLHQRVKDRTDFRISIALETTQPDPQIAFAATDTIITLTDVPVLVERTIQVPDLGLGGSDILMSYRINDAGSRAQVLAAASVDGRTVPIPNLVRSRDLPPGYSATFLFESPLFTGKSDSTRQTLELPGDLPLETLQKVLRLEIRCVLRERLPEIEKRNARTREHVEKQYPHLVGLFDDDTVGIIVEDEVIESAQRRFFLKQKEVLEAQSVDEETFKKSLELSARTLAEYILYREVTIKKLRAVSPDAPEATAHNLLVPRFETFTAGKLDRDIFRYNAWLLDDKFMSFRTVLSEGSMDSVIQAITLEGEKMGTKGFPDIAMVFSADPDDPEPVDVVVVEMKRRKVDGRENTYVAAQLRDRATKLVDHCNNIERMWYFGVIEIDDEFGRQLRNDDWKRLFSRGPQVYYREFTLERKDGGEGVPTPFYLLSYEAIIEDAAARNHTFLEILKSDIRRAITLSGAHSEEPSPQPTNHQIPKNEGTSGIQ